VYFQINWRAARSLCQKIGMQLATFETRREMELVAKAAPIKGCKIKLKKNQ